MEWKGTGRIWFGTAHCTGLPEPCSVQHRHGGGIADARGITYIPAGIPAGIHVVLASAHAP